MKRLATIVLSLMVLGLSGCVKELAPFDHQKQLEIDKQKIEKYVNDNQLPMMMHENSGIYYMIITEPINEGGLGNYIYRFTDATKTYVETPIVTIKYKGKLLDGTVFDENTTGLRYNLAGLIKAWQMIVLPSAIDGITIGGITQNGLQAGYKVRFITPSYWAYQNNAQGTIPANSPLEFEIEVVKIEPPVQ